MPVAVASFREAVSSFDYLSSSPKNSRASGGGGARRACVPWNWMFCKIEVFYGE